LKAFLKPDQEQLTVDGKEDLWPITKLASFSGIYFIWAKNWINVTSA